MILQGCFIFPSPAQDLSRQGQLGWAGCSSAEGRVPTLLP